MQCRIMPYNKATIQLSFSKTLISRSFLVVVVILLTGEVYNYMKSRGLKILGKIKNQVKLPIRLFSQRGMGRGTRYQNAKKWIRCNPLLITEVDLNLIIEVTKVKAFKIILIATYMTNNWQTKSRRRGYYRKNNHNSKKYHRNQRNCRG